MSYDADDSHLEWNDSGDDGDSGGSLPAFVKSPLGALRRRWLWMLLALLPGLAATGFLVARQVPMYKASATVLITSQQIPEDFVRSTVREDSLANLNAMVGEVLSQRQLSALVEKYGLYPELHDEMPMIEIVTEMRSRITIESQQNLRQRRKSQSENSGIFAVSYEYPDPEKAAAVANDLASFFTTASLERRSQQARLTTEFLRKELEEAERELRDHNVLVTEFQTRNRGELPGDLEANLRKLERLQQQRLSLPVLIAEKQERLRLLDSEVSASSAQKEMLVALRGQLAEQLGLHTDEHPNIIALRRRITQMEAEMSEIGVLLAEGPVDRSTEIATTRREIEQLRLEQTQADEAIAQLDLQVQQTPGRTEELTALQEKAEVLRENYLEFLRKVQDSELAETLESAQQGERISVLDRAQAPATPIRSQLKILLAGVAASLAMALAIGVLLELVDPVVVASEQLEQICERPLLGSVPQLA